MTSCPCDVGFIPQAPRPEQVRPECVLRKSLDLMKTRWRTGSHKYLDICEQLKSIRQDLTVRHLPGVVRRCLSYLLDMAYKLFKFHAEHQRLTGFFQQGCGSSKVQNDFSSFLFAYCCCPLMCNCLQDTAVW